jgi:hypothetical protein
VFQGWLETPACSDAVCNELLTSAQIQYVKRMNKKQKSDKLVELYEKKNFPVVPTVASASDHCQRDR